MENKSVYKLAYMHCRCTRTLEETLNKNVNINNYIGCNFEKIFSSINSIFKNVKDLGLLTTVDVVLDIMRYHDIVDLRKFLIGSSDLEGMRLIGLNSFVNIITIDGVTLRYIDKIYLDTYFK